MESRTKWFVIGLVGIAVLLAILFLIKGITSIVSRPSDKQTVSKVVPVAKLTVSAANIVKDPLVYDGLTVEVNTAVSDWITKRVFAVTAGSASVLFGGTNTQLIVIAPKDYSLNTTTSQKGLGLGELTNVDIKGKVRIVDRAEFERLTGIDLDGENIKLDDNNITNWEKEPVIILDSVTKL